jgi:hypothetical protein
VVVDEFAGGVPMRDFRWFKGRRHYSGWHWTLKMRRRVVYESRLELSRIMLGDCDPMVVTIAAQPLQLNSSDGARTMVRGAAAGAGPRLFLRSMGLVGVPDDIVLFCRCRDRGERGSPRVQSSAV